MITKSIEATIHLITISFISITGFIYLCYRFFIKKELKRNNVLLEF